MIFHSIFGYDSDKGSSGNLCLIATVPPDGYTAVLGASIRNKRKCDRVLEWKEMLQTTTLKYSEILVNIERSEN